MVVGPSMRQLDLEQLEKLYKAACQVVDIPVPTRLLWTFLPKEWRVALLELASAVNDMRYSKETAEITIIGFREDVEGHKLLVED